MNVLLECTTNLHILGVPLHPSFKSKKQFLCDQFEIPHVTHHRSGDDAGMCACLFLREIKYVG